MRHPRRRPGRRAGRRRARAPRSRRRARQQRRRPVPVPGRRHHAEGVSDGDAPQRRGHVAGDARGRDEGDDPLRARRADRQRDHLARSRPARHGALVRRTSRGRLAHARALGRVGPLRDPPEHDRRRPVRQRHVHDEVPGRGGRGRRRPGPRPAPRAAGRARGAGRLPRLARRGLHDRRRGRARWRARQLAGRMAAGLGRR